MDKEARKEDARFMAKLLMVFIVCFVLIHVAPALAQNLVAQDQQGNRLTISDKPCSHAGWLKDWKHADLLYQGKQYVACWKPIGDHVLVIDNSGDVFPFPIGMFRKEEGA